MTANPYVIAAVLLLSAASYGFLAAVLIRNRVLMARLRRDLAEQRAADLTNQRQQEEERLSEVSYLTPQDAYLEGFDDGRAAGFRLAETERVSSHPHPNT